MMNKARIAVLVSGGGTNLQALIDAQTAGIISSGEIALVISNKAGAYALERAAAAGIKTETVLKKETPDFEGRIIELLEENGIDPYFYTARRREYDEILPWEHMDYGVTKKFLIKENMKAHNGEITVSCREKCSGCGAAKLNGGVCDEIRQTVV